MGLLMAGKPANLIRHSARLAGMTTMREDAWKKALAGVTTVDECIRRTRSDEPLHHKSFEKAAAS